MEGYQRLLDKRINPTLGDVPLKKLDVETLDRFYNALSDDGPAPASVRQIHAIIRAACGQAKSWDGSAPTRRPTPLPHRCHTT
jgi:hypothetical protein